MLTRFTFFFLFRQQDKMEGQEDGEFPVVLWYSFAL